MQYRNLKSTNLNVSEISLGCWTLGGPNVNHQGIPCGWKAVDEKEVMSAVHFALDQGVNHFDNADIYGNGKAERLLEKSLGEKTKDVIIATKVGYFLGTAEHAYDPIHIRHQCEQSLKNLNRDVIDIYYFHNCSFGPNDLYLEEALATFQKLKEEGKIRYIGLSDWSDKAILRVIDKINPQVVQSWASSLDDHFISTGALLRKKLEEKNISYVTFSPLAQGLLLDKYDPNHPPQFEAGDNRLYSRKFKKDFLQNLKPRLQKIKERFGAETKDLAAVALRYLLKNPVVGCVIPGFRTLSQVQCNLSAAALDLSDEDVLWIRKTLQ